MDVRIGVIYSPREIDVDMADDTDPSQLRAQVAEALTDDRAVLWLTDRRGRQVGVPAGKVAYVEIGPAESSHRIGFAG